MNTDTVLINAAHCLSDSSEEIRYMAVKDLGEVNSLGAVPLLIQAVGDSSYRVREEALQKICSFPAEYIFPRLESFLRNQEDANLRNAALEAFPRYGKEATSYLLNLLKDHDEEVRMFAAVMLGTLEDQLAVPALMKALEDSNDNVRHAAAESLGKIRDSRSVNALIDCLGKDFWIQYPAVVALGNIGDSRAAAALAALLSDEILKQPVVEALGKIGDVTTIPIMSKVLSQKDSFIRNTAIAALINIQARIDRHILSEGECLPSIKRSLESEELVEHLLDSLKETDLDVRKNAIISLGWLRQKRAVNALVELINDYELEQYVVGALISIGTEAVPELIKGLDNPDPKIKMSLIRCIGWIGEEEGIKACKPYLKDKDTEVRYHAIMAMKAAVESEDIENVLISMIGDSEQEINGALCEVLGKSKSTSLADKLLPDLKSNNNLRKRMTIRILGQLRSPSSFQPLRELLDDEERDEIRAEIYKALSAICPEKLSGEILRAGLADKSPTVRKASAGCLAVTNRKAAEEELLPLLRDPDPEVRLAVLDTLGRMGSFICIKHLMEIFGDADKRSRPAILQVLGNIRDQSCIPFLVSLLQDSDPDLRRATLDALGEIRDEKTVPNIIVTLDDFDWSVRNAAISALGKINDRNCISHLLKKLDDHEDIVKKKTISVLGSLGAQEAVNNLLPLMYNENLQLDVLNAVEKLGIPDPDFYYDFFRRSNTRLKCLLVDSLGRIKDTKTLGHLVKILSDEFYTVRCRAAKALGEMGDKRAVSALIKAQKEDPSEEVRKEAASALKRLDIGK